MDNEGRYKYLRKIGEGTYGNVNLMHDTVTNRSVAMKRIKIVKDDVGIPINALREISLMKKLNHPSIMKYSNVLSNVGIQIHQM